LLKQTTDNTKKNKKEMGKYKASKRMAVQSARVMLQKVENLMKGGAIPKPIWYDAAKMVMRRPYFFLFHLLSKGCDW
jgi:hypothetical protein